MTQVLQPKVAVRPVMERSAANPDLPAWHRVGCLCLARINEHGHALMATGQIRRELGLSSVQVSEAISTAKSKGWLDPASRAACLVLPGHGLNKCEEWHQ